MGDRIGPEFDKIGVPVFSPDGGTVAYPVRGGGKGTIVIGENVGDEFDDVGGPAFSPDGKKVAFGARSGREIRWVVVNVK